MHPIVPIIMALGLLTFITGLFIYTRNEIKQQKIVTIRGTDYRLWKFVITTVTLGIALVMLSVYIHKQVPYQIEQEVPEVKAPLSSNLKYELESIMPDYENSPLSTYVTRFLNEYKSALNDDDETTMSLLSLEMELRIKTALQEQGRSTDDIAQETKRIMTFLKQHSQ